MTQFPVWMRRAMETPDQAGDSIGRPCATSVSDLSTDSMTTHPLPDGKRTATPVARFDITGYALPPNCTPSARRGDDACRIYTQSGDLGPARADTPRHLAAFTALVISMERVA